MLAKDQPKSHGMTTVFKDYDRHNEYNILKSLFYPVLDCNVERPAFNELNVRFFKEYNSFSPMCRATFH